MRSPYAPSTSRPPSGPLLGWVAAVLLAAAGPALAADAPRPLSQSVRERWTYRDGLPHNVVHRLLFTILDPGRYVFEVSAANALGVWGPPARLAFEVEPHFWQAPWFAATLALLALGALVLGPVWRIHALGRREALLAARVEEEMRQVKILRGLLPTCAWCSKIKDEVGDWRRFEDYVTERSEARFTHGMCPDCYARLGGGEDPP